MPYDIPGLLGKLAGLPNAIGQGLLGPQSVNPALGLDPGQVGQARRQSLQDLAFGLMAGGQNQGQTLFNARQNAQQGFSGRVFDMLKENEMSRMLEDRKRQEQANSTYRATLPAEMQPLADVAGMPAVASAQLAGMMAPPGEKWRPMTPEEVAQSNLDPNSDWQVNEATGKIDKLFSPPAPAATVSVNLPAQETELGKALGKGAGEEFVGMSTNARSAVSTLEQLNEIEPLTKSPAFISGTLGDARLTVAKALGLPGVEETQTYFAAVGRQVGENIKMFGAGTGLSDADREFAKQMAAGSIELTPQSIQKIIRINRRVSETVIRNYNKRRGELADPGTGTKRPEILGLFPELSVPASGNPVDALLDKYAPRK
jgi:hypothetical protein